MVSTPLVTIVILILVGITATYLITTLTGSEQPIIERPSFIDFSLEQDGAEIIIRNTGARIILPRSLEIYFDDTLLDLTNDQSILSASTYKIKLSKFPSFQGKINITVILNDINKSLEVLSIVENVQPLSELYPPLPKTQPPSLPAVKIYRLSTGTIGSGSITSLPVGPEYEEGTEVEVSATPDKNHTFGYWFFDGAVVYSNYTTVVKMDKNHSLEAVFLLRSDVDCARKDPTILINTNTPSNYMGMIYSVDIKNNDEKCGPESFSITISCPTGFICERKEATISVDSKSTTSTTVTINPKNASSVNPGTYSFSITVKNRADTKYISTNSSVHKIFKNLVQPVIFFTNNYTVDNTLVDFFKEKIFEIRKFYFDNNNDQTFQSLPISTVAGDEYNEFYWCNGATDCSVANQFEGNVINELQAKDYPVHPDWNQFPANRVVWVLAIGGGGYAGARQYPTGGGFAMVGDAAVYGTIDGNCDRVKDMYFSADAHPNAKDHCQNTWIPSGKIYGYGIGALTHELGHTFGLPHPDAYGYQGGSVQWSQTIMGEHWNYPDSGLLEEDRNILASSKFFLN